MGGHYILEGKKVVPCDLLTWGAWLENHRNERIVEQTELPNGKWVSTVFLGLDHQWGAGPPLIFETMIFPKRGDYSDEYCARYTTWKQAEEGHKLAVEIARANDGPIDCNG